MFKHYFEQIQNIEIWPIISLIIFFVFFTATTIWVLFLDKKYIEKMKSLPFDDGADETKTNLKI
ncbi:MAG: cytochrome C oxidase Cbb3 [Cyclobacteriaceae bacterium]|nr:cytochrome C oxidase Cbb3 [Cyclobacteriaceae bacterium]